MNATNVFPLEGGCDCRHVRYRMETAPLFVHCCHCRWCQRESGASFALNAMIESDRVTVLAAEPEIVDTPSASGYGQEIARCPQLPDRGVEPLRRRGTADAASSASARWTNPTACRRTSTSSPRRSSRG